MTVSSFFLAQLMQLIDSDPAMGIQMTSTVGKQASGLGADEFPARDVLCVVCFFETACCLLLLRTPGKTLKCTFLKKHMKNTEIVKKKELIDLCNSKARRGSPTPSGMLFRHWAMSQKSLSAGVAGGNYPAGWVRERGAGGLVPLPPLWWQTWARYPQNHRRPCLVSLVKCRWVPRVLMAFVSFFRLVWLNVDGFHWFRWLLFHLFRLVWLNVDGFHWFRWLLFHLPGPSILPKGHLCSESMPFGPGRWVSSQFS